ncbi:MAG: VCBS repeat-containing protein [Planctomycetota bacterium]
MSTLVHCCLAVSLLCLGTPRAQTTIHVSPSGNDLSGSGTLGNPYRTIGFAAAIASSGDTLQLTAGDFGDDDQIVLGSKDLSIIGAGMGATVVRPHATLMQTMPTGFLPGVAGDHVIGIAVDGPGRVDLRDLTVDCAFRMPSTGSGRLHGVYFRSGGDGTLNRVEIVNARADPLDEEQGPAAVLVRGDALADACEVTLHDCVVHEFGKAGVVGLFNAKLEVRYSSFEAAGPVPSGSAAQNCIQIGPFDASAPPPVANLHHNLVSGADHLVVFGPTQVAASGILLFDAGAGCRIEANEIARCADNISIARSAAGTAQTFVRHNTSTEAIYRALRVQNVAGVIAEHNVLHLANVTPLWGSGYDRTAGGNTWLCNNYSDWSGFGSYAVPGGTSSDTKPRRGCDEFGVRSASIPTAGLPQAVTVADLDGLGAADLASVDIALQPALTVALANSAAPLTYNTTSVSFGSSRAVPVALAAGEFDGAAGTDLVAITRTVASPFDENKFYIFANDGSGGFSLAHTERLVGAIAPTDLAVGDLNNDGRDDFVVSHAGSGIDPGGWSVVRNTGSATAWARVRTPLTLVCNGIALGTLDANASLDVAVTEGNASFGQVRLYTNNGSGAFAELGQSPLRVDADPRAIDAFDPNGDGRADLVVACSGAPPLPPRPVGASVVYVQNVALPTGLTTRSFPVDDAPVALVTGDVGRDSDPDSLRSDAVVLHGAPRSATVLGDFGLRGPTKGSLCLLGGPSSVPAAVALAELDVSSGFDSFEDLVIADTVGSQILILAGGALSREDVYGTGCAGTAGRVPLIAVDADPQAGEAAVAVPGTNTFGIQMSNARPLSLALLLLSPAPAFPLAPPCGGLQVPLFPAPTVLPAAVAPDGTAFRALPLPTGAGDPYHGAALYLQWAVVDPLAPELFGISGLTLALSQGLQIRLGS